MGPGGPARAGPTPPPDQVALMTQRLQSFYWNNRKDAAYTLGRLGDPRAVPSLVHVLKYDLHKDVRIASAIALGEIGGSDAAIALERCSIYDHKDDVRHAASTALERLNTKAKAAPPISSEDGAVTRAAAASRSDRRVRRSRDTRELGNHLLRHPQATLSRRRLRLNPRGISRRRRPHQ